MLCDVKREKLKGIASICINRRDNVYKTSFEAFDIAYDLNVILLFEIIYICPPKNK